MAAATRNAATKGREVAMRESGKKNWKRSIAAGVLGTVLFAGVSLGVEARMQTERSGAKRSNSTSTSTSRGRVVEFKPEGTDSWLCTYVSPFFCDVVPTVTNSAAPAPGTAMEQRGRR
jgi:hypothetical protein